MDRGKGAVRLRVKLTLLTLLYILHARKEGREGGGGGNRSKEESQKCKGYCNTVSLQHWILRICV